MDRHTHRMHYCVDRQTHMVVVLTLAVAAASSVVVVVTVHRCYCRAGTVVVRV